MKSKSVDLEIKKANYKGNNSNVNLTNKAAVKKTMGHITPLMDHYPRNG